MPDYDLLIRGGEQVPVIGITGGVFAGFQEGFAREEVDATGLMVLPGVIDAHVHFNEPGRADWEGWATGSRAAVAGGITTVGDMPLNSTPPVVTVAAFEAKLRAALASSVCDFALWGGLIPGYVDQIAALAAAGVMGFKAFMAHSGVDDFPRADLATLRAGMQRAAQLGLPVAVHAEFDRPISPDAGTSVADYIASRPIDSECEAILAAIGIAAETGCALHVVHVSSGRGVSLIADARARGVNVTAETCPHYLVFTAADMERLGAVAKCAPPFRDPDEQAALRAHVLAGRVDTIGSDHSPSPWSLKTDANFFRVWGGIAGIQHLLPLLFELGRGQSQGAGQRQGQGADPALIARLTAENVARRFGFARKGRLAVGYDADLVLIDPRDDYEVDAGALFYRHRLSPYVGRRLHARVRRTIRRGQTVYQDGRVLADRGGQLVRPDAHPPAHTA
jgi:allantoinase